MLLSFDLSCSQTTFRTTKIICLALKRNGRTRKMVKCYFCAFERTRPRGHVTLERFYLGRQSSFLTDFISGRSLADQNGFREESRRLRERFVQPWERTLRPTSAGFVADHTPEASGLLGREFRSAAEAASVLLPHILGSVCGKTPHSQTCSSGPGRRAASSHFPTSKVFFSLSSLKRRARTRRLPCSPLLFLSRTSASLRFE